MASFNAPAPNHGIIADVNAVNELLSYLAQIRPDLASWFPEGSVRFYQYDATNDYWTIQVFKDGVWKNAGRLYQNVRLLQGYEPSTSAVAGKIPVYNASAHLVGNITGNAVTATKLATARSIQVGGILSSTAQNFDGSSNVTIPVNQVTINNEADTAVNGTLTKAHGGTGRTDGASSDVVVTGTASSILARSVGQIGQAKIIVTATDLDSIIERGLYICQSNMTIETNNVPEPNGTNPCFLEVSHQGNYIIQRWELVHRIWQRRSTDRGASWGPWYPLGGFKGNIIIYISKSGSDSNTGLDPAYPVLTFERVFQIADSFAQGNALTTVYLRIGAGEWGDIAIYNKPYLILMNPYDGQMPTAYSSSLPIFQSITIHNSWVYVGGFLLYGFLQAYWGAKIFVQKGFKRLWVARAIYNSLILFQSDGADTNLLEMGGRTPTNIGFQVEKGGCIYVDSINIKLITHITAYEFLRVASGSKFFLSSSLTNFLATNAIFTGRKYFISAGGEVYTDENITGIPALLNSLPGTMEGTSYPGSIFNGWPRDAITGSNTVTINSDQTITGQKIFKNAKGVNTLRLVGSAINLSGAPSSSQYVGFSFVDSENIDRLQFYLLNHPSNYIYITLRMLNPANGVTPSLSGVYNRLTGISYWACDTPPSDANGTHIATTSWVRARISEGLTQSPRQLVQKALLDNINGTAKLEGIWTIPNLIVNLPVFVLFNSMNTTGLTSVYLACRAYGDEQSNANGGITLGRAQSNWYERAFLLGREPVSSSSGKGGHSTDCFITIPSATSIKIWYQGLNTNEQLVAYQ